MIEFNETSGNESIYDVIKKELIYLTSFISYQKTLKEYITKTYEVISSKITLSTEENTHVNGLYKIVSQAKLDVDCNIINLQKLFKELRKLKVYKGPTLQNCISSYNDNYTKYISKIESNTKYSKKIAKNLYSILDDKPKLLKKYQIYDVPQFNTDPVYNNYSLKISTKSGKVFLPYSISELNKIIENNPNKYSSKQDLINKKYIIPISTYKHSSFSRFKESYKLIREKENGSISEGLNLGFEMFFNYNLDPAIITACKNLDELDIYLDCLNDNELDDFYCFDIIYESKKD